MKNRSADTKAVHGRNRHAVILLPDLEPAQILRCRRFRRAAKEGREPSDIAELVALRFLAELAQAHVVNQPLCSGPAERDLASYLEAPPEQLRFGGQYPLGGISRLAR
ncbi:hypothetical protein [Mesorhizobium sp.]|uniref:hypothetical protein n=1 Tax=Mesorhizobium sp. TaxID=1871066 RepID=UPI0025C47B9A|nr:hypothetical protein [Mesorhizobium sp.]